MYSGRRIVDLDVADMTWYSKGHLWDVLEQLMRARAMTNTFHVP